jgi:hypothetical protein
MKQFRASLFLCLYFVAILASPQTNRNLRLGNPSDATSDPQNPDNYLLVKKNTPSLTTAVAAHLEDDSRKLALKGNTLYILAGCYGDIGHIGKTNTVVIPKSCWKMAVVEGPNPQGHHC